MSKPQDVKFYLDGDLACTVIGVCIDDKLPTVRGYGKLANFISKQSCSFRFLNHVKDSIHLGAEDDTALKDILTSNNQVFLKSVASASGPASGSDVARLMGVIENLRVEIQAKDSQRDAELQQMKDTMTYVVLAKFQSLSHTAAYDALNKSCGFLWSSDLLKDFPQPDQQTVQLLWDTCKYERKADEGEPERQILIEVACKQILLTNPRLKGWYQKHIYDPEKIPDISITSSMDRDLTWQGAVVVMEVEDADKNKEGVGQACSYAVIGLQRTRRTSGICVYTDADKIEMIRITPKGGTGPEVHTCGELALFPYVRPEDPTPGFALLVRLLQASLQDFGAQLHPTSRPLSNKSTLDLKEYIGYGCTSHVYSADLGGQLVAVKVLVGEQNAGHFRREARTLQLLSTVSPGTFPTLHNLSTSNTLVISPLGDYTLRQYATKLVTLRESITIVKEVVEQLQKAHNAGITHNDLRPSNILLCKHNGGHSVKIIDWGHSTKYSEGEYMSGSPAYAATSLLIRTNPQPSPATDIESCIYILLFLTRGLGWLATMSPAVINDKRKAIQEEHVVELLSTLMKNKKAPHQVVIEKLNKYLATLP